jgi:hypothetical protein
MLPFEIAAQQERAGKLKRSFGLLGLGRERQKRVGWIDGAVPQRSPEKKEM